MVNRIIFFSSIIFVLLLCSCKTPGDVRTETASADRMSELELALANAANTAEEIKAEHEAIKGRIERLEHLLLEKDAVMNTKIDTFIGEQAVSTSEGAVVAEESNTGSATPANASETIDVVPATTPSTSPVSALTTATPTTASTTIASTTTPTTTTVTAPNPSNPLLVVTSVKNTPVQTLDQKYKKARELHEQKKYNEAMPLYFEVQGSKSNWYRERAMFYIGVLNYDISKYKESIISMQEFIDAYPKSKNVPPAILVQAESFIALKQNSDAKVFLNDLILRFPTSKEAQKAKNKIKSL